MPVPKNPPDAMVDFAREASIVHAAAGEADCRERCVCGVHALFAEPDALGSAGKTYCQPGMKSCADLACGDFCAQVGEHLAQHFARFYEQCARPIGDFYLVGAAIVFARHAFQFDCGLRLVVYRMPAEHESGNGVEETAAA